MKIICSMCEEKVDTYKDLIVSICYAGKNYKTRIVFHQECFEVDRKDLLNCLQIRLVDIPPDRNYFIIWFGNTDGPTIDNNENNFRIFSTDFISLFGQFWTEQVMNNDTPKRIESI